MSKIREVVLTKNDPQPNDYRELTFKDFIIIQNVAQQVADNVGYPVYLVGSALRKHLPRDIDLSIIMPSDVYVERYTDCGPYEMTNPEYEAGAYLANAWYAEFENIQPLEQLNIEGYHIDLKICPDNWFPEKEKIVLANPKEETK